MPVSQAEAEERARAYTEAWCSHVPEAVTSFYAEDGRITINGGEPSNGREQVTEMARGFIGAFPDIIVHMDDIRSSGTHAVYRWTLEGHNTGPGGTGSYVKIGPPRIGLSVDTDARPHSSLVCARRVFARRMLGPALRAIPQELGMSKKLFVGGLAWATTDQGLHSAFAAHGEIAEAVVITDRESGRSRGFGFVTFVSDGDAQNAISAMNGQELDGRTLNVNEAQDRRGGGGGGGRDRDGGGRDRY